MIETITVEDKTRTYHHLLFHSSQNSDENRMTILLPEFYGRSEYSVKNAQRLAEAGTTVFLIDYYGSEKHELSEDKASKEYEIFKKNIDLNITDIARAVEDITYRSGCSKDEIIIVGFSLGGWLAFLLAEQLNNVKKIIPVYGNLKHLKVLPQTEACISIIHGDMDEVTSIQQVKSLIRRSSPRTDNINFHIINGGRHGFCSYHDTANYMDAKDHCNSAFSILRDLIKK